MWYISKKKTVKEAILTAYSKLPKRFTGISLVRLTRKHLNKPTMDATILRIFRYLRYKGFLNYKIINKRKSIYEKDNY